MTCFKHNKSNLAANFTIYGTAIAAALALLAPEAQAWEFDTCSSKLETEVEFRQPQAMIMLDKSGSMKNILEDVDKDPDQDWGIWRYGGSIWPNNQRTEESYDTNAHWADPFPEQYYDPSLGGRDPDKDPVDVWSAPFINQSPMIEPSYGYFGPSPQSDSEMYRRSFWFDEPGSLWDVSVRELGDVLKNYDAENPAAGDQPKIKFGLGTYTNWYTNDVIISAPGWGMIWSEASEYSDSDTFMEFFRHPQQGGPSRGATPTQQAIDVMRQSSTINNENTANSGILITDGVPNLWYEDGIAKSDHDGPRAHAASVEAACRHRETAPMFVIGFSDLADPEFNNLVAAAGGTGSCVDEQNTQVDPCDGSHDAIDLVNKLNDDKLSCTGAYQADTGDEIKQALDAVISEISCTYPLDVLNAPGRQAPEDPEGSRVFLGACDPGPATQKAMGSEYTSQSRGEPYMTSRAELGLPCSGVCGAVNSKNGELVYELPTTPGEEHTARVRVADYLHNCSDPIKLEVRMDSTEVLGQWIGEGINDWNEIEFNFTPTHDRTFISVVQLNDAHCEGEGNCDPSCDPFSGDLNLYVDWVKVVDPQAGCSGVGGLSYQPPGSNSRGWTFNENRSQVKLVGSACSNVQSGRVDRVVTQVACPCEEITGSMCRTGSGATCPVGFWECTDHWQDICVPDDECEIGECAPVTQHDLSRRQPNVQMVVDNSGSMAWRIADSRSGNKIEDDPDEARHNIARRVLADLAQWSHKGLGCYSDGTNCDRLRLGIHFWSTSKKKKYSAQEDMTPEMIKNAFDTNSPTGGTNFHLAGELLRDESALTDPDAANIGLMVTDGEPSSLSTVQQDLTTTCNIRKRDAAPIATYVLGFGVQNADHVNSLVAAAGGTGSCCEGPNCRMDDPESSLDPCELSASQRNKLAQGAYYNNYTHYYGEQVTCEGNISATTPDALKNELMSLFQSFECVFPLTLLPDMESASKNPVGTRVHIYMNNAGDLVKVPYVEDTEGQQQFVAQLASKGVADAEDFIDDGWSFANSGRTAVRLSKNVCDQIQADEVSRVDTQVCKVCENTGDECEVPCNPGDEHCGDDGYLMGRCRIGEVICVKGKEYCVQTRNPMPEICNGIDDDCNGVVDDLSASVATWTDAEWDFAQYEDKDFTALACYGNNVCTCAGGEADPAFGKATDFDELYSHLSGQHGIQESVTANCYCGEGISEAAGTPPPASWPAEAGADAAAEGGAMCSMSGSTQSSALDAWWFVGLLGIAGAGRLRRRLS